MRDEPYLKPTAVQRVRGFLAEGGEPVVGWATPDEVLNAAWASLWGRRDDSAFWRRLGRLAESLGEDAGRNPGEGRVDPAAEVLDRADIERLVEELRAAVRSSSGRPEQGSARRMLSRLRVPVTMCLLAVGSGVACAGRPPAANDPAPSADATPWPDVPPEAVAADVPADAPVETSPALSADEALDRFSARAGLDARQREKLQTCFRERLSDTRKAELVSLFRDRTPEDIAAVLEGMLAPEGECGVTRPLPDCMTDPNLPGVCIVPIYKGVSFG